MSCVPVIGAQPAFTKRKGSEKIPITLPAKRPTIMPNELEIEKLPTMLDGMVMAVLTKAKIGTIINATGLCKKCFRRSFFLSQSLAGKDDVPI